MSIIYKDIGFVVFRVIMLMNRSNFLTFQLLMMMGCNVPASAYHWMAATGYRTRRSMKSEPPTDIIITVGFHWRKLTKAPIYRLLGIFSQKVPLSSFTKFVGSELFRAAYFPSSVADAAC